MKKWIPWLLLILILTLSCIYFFIPSKIVISSITTAKATIFGEFRNISQEENWEKWWRDGDGKSHVKADPFTYNGTRFRITNHSYNVAGIEIDQNGIKLPSVLHLISFTLDSTGAIWQCETPASINPLTRIRNYRNAREIKKNMTGVMKNFKSFISSPENIYGISIYRVSTNDTTMLSARFTSAAYPTTSELYGYFAAVDQIIKKQKGKSTSYPMMNIRKLENDSFETQVALPTTQKLSDDGKFSFRRMIPGNFMTAEVRGGAYTANEAQKQLELFIADYNRSKIANSFQLLVTNRLREPDTLKWITKIYVPVIQ
jgi:hypothetical protein